MAEAPGRKLLLQRSTDGGTNYATVASIRTKSFTIANEPIDITTDDSDAWRTLLSEPGNRTLDMSGSGVAKDDVLLAASLGSTSGVVLQNYQMVLPSGAKITGDFAMTSFGETGEYQDAVTFDLELQSSGEPIFTAAP